MRLKPFHTVRAEEVPMAKSSSLSSIDDLTYDVITVLRKKAKALEAYDKYVSDAEAEDDEELKELFASMRKRDEEDVQVLKETLARRLDEDLGYSDEDEDEDYDDEEEEEEEEEDDQEPGPPRVDVRSGAAVRRPEGLQEKVDPPAKTLRPR